MNSKLRNKAVVLLSGGLDSATGLAIATQEGYRAYCLTFEYGQRHARELECAKRIAKSYKVSEHRIIAIDLRAFGGSALTGDIEVPRGRTEAEMAGGIPVTYVPARNTIFLSYALAYAEVIEASDIFIGVNAVDYSGYPDCRPEYILAFQKMANLATKRAVSGNPVKIHAPLLNLSKSAIIKKGLSLGVDYGQTHSCYDPSEAGEACGVCDSCQIRLKAFEEADIEDPVKYIVKSEARNSKSETNCKFKKVNIK